MKVSLDRITVAYGAMRPALDGITATFEEGRFNVLLGPSGAGKSTLLKVLNGLARPSSGTITIGGQPLELAHARDLRAHRRRTAMIFQQHHLVLRRTALDNVVIGRLGHMSRAQAFLPVPRHDKMLALAALERVGLLDKALVSAGKLSGGEQQRVGIARALVAEPRLLLADEPVASLDPATSESIMALISRIAREDGLTVVLSLHQVELARRHAGWITGLSSGRVIFEGPPGLLDAAALDRIYADAATASPMPRDNGTRAGDATVGRVAAGGAI